MVCYKIEDNGDIFYFETDGAIRSHDDIFKAYHSDRLVEQFVVEIKPKIARLSERQRLIYELTEKIKTYNSCRHDIRPYYYGGWCVSIFKKGDDKNEKENDSKINSKS